ncbi:hypothetical protein M9Y10_016641 [Tritrichomonas musculus]|uniref:Uncharacterized protein n=1 Tax=Tritrichomonas musculus TaxID=1915356 RepID=A0ABR2HX61_9EUKA
MDEELAKLFQAFENDGDIHACVKIVARNFPAFSTNDIIFTFPDELLVDIMLSEECVFPEPEQIVTFFIKLFEKGADFVHIYYTLIPLDLLSKDECQKLVDKLTEMKCIVEAKQLSRVANLYEKIDFINSELKENDSNTLNISEKLQHSSDMLERMTTLLRSTTQALDQTTEELKKKTEEVTQKDEEIIKLKFALQSTRK